MPGTCYPLEVNPEILPRLARLEELANDLWYSWNRPARDLFARLSLSLWRTTNHSPKAFLKRIDQHQLTEAATDPIFLDTMDRVLAAYNAYQIVTHIRYGEALRFEFAVQLNGLAPTDLAVEMVFTRPGKTISSKAKHYPLHHEKPLEGGEALFSCELTPEQCGKMEYQVRAYPSHTLLTHPFEMGLMLWL